MPTLINYSRDEFKKIMLQTFIKAVAAVILLAVTHGELSAAVSVTAPTNGVCLDVKPGNFKTLDDIVIVEGVKSDLPTQAGTTFILNAPTGFEFNPGIGTVTGQTPVASGNITALAISVTSTTITITMSVSGTNKWDQINITGIQVRALSYNVTGNITRPAGVAGGTATVNGDAPGGGVSHGFLEAEKADVIYSISDGNWTDPTIWSGGFVPTCIDTIYVRHNVTVNANSPARGVVIEATGILTSNFTLTIDSLFHILDGGTYIHNNRYVASTTIFNGTELFQSNSNIIIQQWHDINVPFPTGINGDFGNITFNEGTAWSQDGTFSTARIKGTLTVSSGTITMDDGTGMTTSLTLNDVIVNNTGALIVASGPNRNLNLITGSFTDISTSGTRTVIIRNSEGNLTWTVNGDVYVSHHFSGYQHSGSNPGVTTIQINGDLTIAGGMFTFNYNVDAPLLLTVTGTTLITGTPNYVRFIDSPTGSLSFTTTDFIVEACDSTELIGGSLPTGNAVVNVLNDFTVSGLNTNIKLYNTVLSPGSTTLTVGNDLSMTGGELNFSNTSGLVTATIGRHVSTSGNSRLTGQINTLTNQNTNIDIQGSLQVENSIFTVSMSYGSIDLSVVEDIFISNGTVYGIYNPTSPASGTANLSCENLNFNGGLFSFYHAISNTGNAVQIDVNTDINVDFNNGTDIFTFIGLSTSNLAVLDLNVANNLTISGNFPGSYFLSSASAGNEDVLIAGNMTVMAGDVYFVGNESGLANNHNITTQINGSLFISGGNTRLSTGAGTAAITVNNDVEISGGILSLKYSTGSGTMTVTGNYTQSAGTFNIHSQNATTADVSTISVYGDFSMSDGTFNFENFSAAAGLAEHALYIYGANYSLAGNAIITHANNLTTNYIFGQIYFSRTGTTTYNRGTSTNEIRHVKYTVNSGTTVDATGSSNGFQMTSVASSSQTYHICLNIYGTLDMGDKILSARQQTNYYSRLTVRNNGRYRLSHTGGLYSANASQPSSIDGFISSLNRAVYNLESSSIVEYYGTSTMMVTGIPNGYATGNPQKYGFLEINHTGTPGATWAYPETSGEVFIRSRLVLTEGEFNLDDDHVTNSGGRIITLETGCTINRTNGFIRSETEDGSGRVAWNIPANGTFTIPFGYDAATYIPFTYQQTSGSTGMLEIGTYRSLADNTPYPPTVTHVRDALGIDNSTQTVDRFWNIIAPGVATANLTFSVASSEMTGIISPRAQLWEPVSQGWFPPSGVQSNPTAVTTSAGGITALNNWWTLSAAASPLPVELINFEARKQGTVVKLDWATASEINNDFFTIERSNNGIQFEEIGIKAGAGNSNETKLYSFIDQNPINSVNYYRLKQTDYDGTQTYSEIKTVIFNESSVFSVFPNPTTDKNQFTVAVPSDDIYRILISDMAGRSVYDQILKSNEAKLIQLNSGDLFKTAGTYLLKVTGQEQNYNTLIVVK